jgi:hypothetical protein
MPDLTTLPARSLSITGHELQALLWTREQLQLGEIIFDAKASGKQGRGFNMSVSDEETECGTTCCIGGWMYKHMTDQQNWAPRTSSGHWASLGGYVGFHRSPALAELFHPFTTVTGPDDTTVDWDVIPPVWAIQAIDNFLATGKPNWPQVCGLVP